MSEVTTLIEVRYGAQAPAVRGRGKLGRGSGSCFNNRRRQRFGLVCFSEGCCYTCVKGTVGIDWLWKARRRWYARKDGGVALGSVWREQGAPPDGGSPYTSSGAVAHQCYLLRTELQKLSPSLAPPPSVCQRWRTTANESSSFVRRKCIEASLAYSV